MIQFLQNSKPIFTSDREDLIGFYTSKGYEVCPILYNGVFIDPIWNGSEFIEGATPEEIAEANKQKVPESISRMHLKIELIKRGIESQEVEDTINAIPSEMFSEIDKKIAITKFNDAVSFDRYNADLQLVATLMGLTQEDLDEIFINGNLLR